MRDFKEDIPRSNLKPFKVLVGAPHNEVKNYCLEEYVNRIKNFTYPNYKILIADNSKTFANKKKLMNMGINTKHVPPRNHVNQEYIAESLEVLRNHTLKRKSDYLLIVETDIIPPVDIIERLMVHQKQIVSASYFIGHGEDSHLMIQDFEEGNKTTWNTVNIKNGKDMIKADGKLQEVYACGIGCILIHHSVLSDIKFRYEMGANAHPDSFFALDLKYQGITQYLDTSILCKHYNRNWAEITDAIR